MNWLKDKTVGKIKRWYSRQLIRAISELKKEQLKEVSKNVPPELKKYSEIADIMNNNATALHNLYREAKDNERFQEAFLYFFYEFEINLKHMIMSEMIWINNMRALGRNDVNLFSVYLPHQINKIQKNGNISKLIKIFCSIFGEEIKKDLTNINKVRNFIIHNMLKKEMSEKQIQKSFEYFFKVTGYAINKSYSFFNKIMKERPKRIIEITKNLADQLADQNKI